MPEFKYTAIGQNGKTIRGRTVAQDRSAVAEKVKQDGFFLTECEELKEKKHNVKLKTPVIADFCRQIGTLLGAGVPLVRALTIIAGEENLRKSEKNVYTGLLKNIRRGESISDAMEKEAPAFPELLVNMMRSAETGGSIDKTAKRMAAHYDKEHKTNSKIKSAMVYPAVLAVMMVGIIIFCCVYILPQFDDIFASMELPVITKAVMGLSDVITSYWYLLIILAFVLVALMKIIMKITHIRIMWDKIKLKLPVVGKLLRTIYTARFARTLSSLYGSGVPIVNSMVTAGRTVGNAYINAQFDEAVRLIKRGESLAGAIKTIDGFELKLVSSVNVGEETGNLGEMLDVIADSYDYESELAINRLVTMMEPLMLIVMGLLVGVIMLAVLIPIFGSYNSIAGSGSDYGNIM
ncbi:MAG: type II secretion system F family protein [Clostridia bacterium]|nr:type II secretion system F family protein [Clostridia bacterium]